ncbi:MAG: single-stranded-DNA-specific exonuclease RecJ [Proteobacteria bacterium]|nr:single-stranded-DNA-specific exonuclease RecJ [Pseudomonadota bacterium]
MTTSLSGATWLLADAPAARVEALLASGLSPVAARCLASRWKTGSADDLLTPRFEHLHDPALMHNMAPALARLEQANRDRQKVRIITDYDVDGTTSSLILQAGLTLAGGGTQIDYHIPNRFKEGYGFSVQAAEKAVADGIDLIVTADIGVRDHAAVTLAKNGGVDVLICDHHLPDGADVPADALVLCPPQRLCSYPNRSLAACGVSLKLAQGLLAKHPKRDAIVRSMLKLAAIGTVADLVPLTTLENRAIVALGLDMLNRGPHHPGLQALLTASALKLGEIRESDLGFRIGPRINAAGRLADAKMVVELMNCRDPERARAMAQEIDQLNTERKEIQRRLVDAAIAQAGDDPPDFVVVSGTEEAGWHRGVVGIVASRLKDEVYRPAAVVSIQGEQAVGSIRSIPGVHAVEALDSVQDILVRYGGHPAAAGFTVPTDKLEELGERLSTYVRETTPSDDLVRRYRYDADVDPRDLNESLEHDLSSLGPFGMGNPRPRLAVRGVQARYIDIRANGRLLKCRIGGTKVDAIWWDGAEHKARLEEGPVDLLGKLEIDTWNGRRRLQLVISDAS